MRGRESKGEEAGAGVRLGAAFLGAMGMFPEREREPSRPGWPGCPGLGGGAQHCTVICRWMTVSWR